MQDRFKFRIWDKIHNRFLCIDNQKRIIFDYEDKEIRILEDEENACWLHIPFDECIILQCTGLKDKNGKLIYEGDIIKFTSVYKCSLFENIKEIIFEVVFDNLKYCLNQIKILKGNYSYPYMLDFGEIFKVGDYDYNQTKIKLEVIGNIYENAELLEE